MAWPDLDPSIRRIFDSKGADSEKTLDQVIIDYLASEAESEHLELSLLNTVDFYAGGPVEVRIATKRSLSQQPIPAAAIEVKVISTVEAPRVIFRGKTAADGTAIVRCTIPNCLCRGPELYGSP